MNKLLVNTNELNRQTWLRNRLAQLEPGIRLLDAGAGELKNRRHCSHLEYVSQDFAQYEGGTSGGKSVGGLHPKAWDNSRIDIVSDIVSIPRPDSSFDVILCSEVLEHIPDPLPALDEFARLLRPGGKLILTAPFSSNVHFAPYHFCTGFSKYWYLNHLPARGFRVLELSPNGDWYSLLGQELRRLGGLDRSKNRFYWPISYFFSFLGLFLLRLNRRDRAHDLACFGWHCIAIKEDQTTVKTKQ